MKKILITLSIFIMGMVAFAGVNVFFEKTNETEFCTGCHSMKIPLEEYTHSVHFNNRTGVQAECADCHVPKSFFPKVAAKIMAAKDVYHWVLGTIEPDTEYFVTVDENGECGVGLVPVKTGSSLCIPNYGEKFDPEEMSDEATERRELAIKKYEAYRWKMANRVWDRMKESDSRECKSCHAFENMDLDVQDRSARKKHGRAVDKGQTCIDCHKGIAHSEPEEENTDEKE